MQAPIHSQWLIFRLGTVGKCLEPWKVLHNQQEDSQEVWLDSGHITAGYGLNNKLALLINKVVKIEDVCCSCHDPCLPMLQLSLFLSSDVAAITTLVSWCCSYYPCLLILQLATHPVSWCLFACSRLLTLMHTKPYPLSTASFTVSCQYFTDASLTALKRKRLDVHLICNFPLQSAYNYFFASSRF